MMIVGGLMFGAYKGFQAYQSSVRFDVQAQQEAEEASKKRQATEREFAENENRKRDAERVVSESKQRARHDEKTAAALEHKLKTELEEVEQKAKQKAEIDLALAKVSERLKAEQDMRNAAKLAITQQRLDSEAARSAELKKEIAKLESTIQETEKSVKYHNVIFEARKEALFDVWRKYDIKYDGREGKEIWEVDVNASQFIKVPVFGGRSIITESPGPKIAEDINKRASDARFHLAAIKKETTEINTMKDTLLSKKKALALSESEIKEITDKVPELAVKTPEPAKPGTKTILLKNGKTYFATSIMKTETEVTFIDEEGQKQTIPAVDLDKIILPTKK
ncbi:MAG: hypothetical protein WCT04_17990 [Planctomycetota bacterium]